MPLSYHMLMSMHQKRVEEFMKNAKQELPQKPTEPSEAVRLLRAKLIFEEAMETIRDGLGVEVVIDCGIATALGSKDPLASDYLSVRIARDIKELKFEIARSFSMVETIDGCCDLKVVTTGTLSACGVPDEIFQELVDKNNLDKFGPGHSWREDGKLIKPSGHKPPDIAGTLERISKA